MFYASPLLQKNIQSDNNQIEKILNYRGQLGLKWMSPSKERANVFETAVVANDIFFIHVTCKLHAESQHETKIYEH